MVFRIALFLVIPLTNLDVANAQAQSQRSRPANGGAITGQVKDSTGGVIGKAKVTITGNEGNFQTTQAQDDGPYVFRGVADGAYTLSATYNGLTQSSVVAVMLNGSETVHGDIVMKRAEVMQQITVQENPNQVSVDPR